MNSERIVHVASCFEPYFSLQMHTKPELAHRLQTSKMRRNSTSLNTCQHDVNVKATETVCLLIFAVCKAFFAVVKHFAPKCHYFAP